jgi:hypothetical protein
MGAEMQAIRMHNFFVPSLAAGLRSLEEYLCRAVTAISTQSSKYARSAVAVS